MPGPKKTLFQGFLEGKLLAWRWWQITAESIAPNQRKQRAALGRSGVGDPICNQRRKQPRRNHDNSMCKDWAAQFDVQRLGCKPQSYLYCGNDLKITKQNLIPSSIHPLATLAIPFTLRERSCSDKTKWNSIGNSSTSNTCNPIYSEGTILQTQTTMEFHSQIIHQHHCNPI